MARITRTCSLLLGLGLATAPVAADARLSFARSSASTFVAAHAAAEAGDARRAAILYASLAASEPSNGIVARRALAQAILAGDMTLALRLARSRSIDTLPPDARLLLLAEDLRRGSARTGSLAPLPQELQFVTPFIDAWLLAERGREEAAVRVLGTVPADSLLAPATAEHAALIWLRAGKIDEARPLFAEAVRRAGGRADRLRMLFADALAREGRRDEALALLSPNDPTLARAASVLRAGDRRPGPGVTTAAQGLGELLLGLALALNEGDSRALPLALVQVARHADPDNPQGRLLLGLMLGRGGREDEALAMFRTMEEGPFVPDARDLEIELLTEEQRLEEALARAQTFVADRPGADDWTRLGDVLEAMKRHDQAADAYARALAMVETGGAGPERWTLLLLRGASLEQARRWAEAEKALEAAHALAPDNPVVLNYLGYARLERGEQLEEAEALIAEASRRAPDDASITDSLGWAQFKRGRVNEAILTLQRAAAADAEQAEIHEHLGDALYTAGRKYEARFAWNAALVTAEDDVRKRVEAKIASGLTPATAAP